MGDARRTRPRILAIAYACEPGRGSEPGAGWALIEAAAEFAHCTVLVSSEHHEQLSDWKRKHPSATVEFVAVERRLNNPRPWHTRIGHFLAYLVWLRRARSVTEQLILDEPFDAVWHATFAVYWLPSPLRHVGLPFVAGPLGGGVVTPLRLWPALGVRGVLAELLDATAVSLASLWPGTRATWQAADHLLMQNDQSLRRLPRQLRSKSTIVNHAEFLRIRPQTRVEASDSLVWVGAIESRKGPLLAIRALAFSAPHVRLRVIGDGPQLEAMKRESEDRGVADRVEFTGRLPRTETLEYLKSARGAVFTGLREEGGLALAEALGYGVPCVVLAHGGAATIAIPADDGDRIRLVHPARPLAAAAALGAAMTELYDRPVDVIRPSLLQRHHALQVLRSALLDAAATSASPTTD